MRIVCTDAGSVSGSDFGRISVGFSQLKYDILADSRFECRSRGNSRDPRSSASMRTVRNFDCGYATRCPMYISPVDHWFRHRYCVPCVLLPHVESGFVAESVCAVWNRVAFQNSSSDESMRPDRLRCHGISLVHAIATKFPAFSAASGHYW